VLLAALLAAGTLFAVACGGDEEEGGGGGAGQQQASAAGGNPCEGGRVVGYAQPLPDPNFQVLGRVVTQELERRGCRVRITNANLNPGKQVSDIQTLQQQGVDVLITNPVVPEAIQPAINRLRQRDIPVIVQETTRVRGVTTNVTSTVEEAAASGARDLARLTDDGAQVAAIEGPRLAEILLRENQGFRQGAERAGLDVVARRTNTEITPQGARQIATAFRDRYPNLAGLWTFNDTSALGAMTVQNEEWDPVIVSINGQQEAVEAIRRGQIDVTYALQQVKIGHTLAWAALEALAGRELPETIHLPLARVDRENVDEYIPSDRAIRMPFEVRLENRDGRMFVDMGDTITG